jgi:hypothetical protein
MVTGKLYPDDIKQALEGAQKNCYQLLENSQTKAWLQGATCPVFTAWDATLPLVPPTDQKGKDPPHPGDLCGIVILQTWIDHNEPTYLPGGALSQNVVIMAANLDPKGTIDPETKKVRRMQHGPTLKAYMEREGITYFGPGTCIFGFSYKKGEFRGTSRTYNGGFKTKGGGFDPKPMHEALLKLMEAEEWAEWEKGRAPCKWTTALYKGEYYPTHFSYNRVYDPTRNEFVDMNDGGPLICETGSSGEVTGSNSPALRFKRGEVLMIEAAKLLRQGIFWKRITNDDDVQTAIHDNFPDGMDEAEAKMLYEKKFRAEKRIDDFFLLFGSAVVYYCACLGHKRVNSRDPVVSGIIGAFLEAISVNEEEREFAKRFTALRVSKYSPF